MEPCPSCKKKISINATVCPNCGNPNPFSHDYRMNWMDEKIKEKEREKSKSGHKGKKDEVVSKEYGELESRLGVGNWKQESKEEREQRKNERRIENSKNLKRGLIAGVLVMIYYFFRKFWMNL